MNIYDSLRFKGTNTDGRTVFMDVDYYSKEEFNHETVIRFTYKGRTVFYSFATKWIFEIDASRRKTILFYEVTLTRAQ
ncbi:MAG: hypothetical protein GY861_24265 [bacterium]|nr:hypothetical protein [bacterium]